MSSHSSRKKSIKRTSTAPLENHVSENTMTDISSKLAPVINRLKMITLYEVNTALSILVIILFMLLLFTPEHAKRKRNAVLRRQFYDLTTSITNLHETITKKYEYFLYLYKTNIIGLYTCFLRHALYRVLVVMLFYYYFIESDELLKIYLMQIYCVIILLIFYANFNLY